MYVLEALTQSTYYTSYYTFKQQFVLKIDIITNSIQVLYPFIYLKRLSISAILGSVMTLEVAA